LGRVNERDLVLGVLLENEKKGTYSHILVREMLDAHQDLSEQQRAFMKRLTEGTLERRIELDSVIDRFSKKPASGLRPLIRQILRMGIYQILYMDSVPDSAAASEAVKLAKLHRMDALSGFVNAVLRNVIRSRDKGELESLMGEASLSVRYSMPQWLIDLWKEQLGEEETDKLLKSLLEIRPVCIRFSPDEGPEERERILSQMREAGTKVTPGRWLPYAFCLTGTSALQELPGYREGLWTIQDESSMFAVEACGIRGGETVMDVCAAPGGKSMHAASLLKEGRVLAFDLSHKKTEQIRKNIRRMGMEEKISVSEQDARVHNSRYEACADILLCDLPCSGLGIIGRKRDIKYRISRQELTDLAALQREILKNAVTYLKPGGVLIYSTCTIDALENQENADYIEKELKLQADSLVPFLPPEIPGIEGEGMNRLQLLPHVHGTDGFFVARFRKPQS
jgi:16S rRNA (cytosine967-C5)-methyltransferase